MPVEPTIRLLIADDQEIVRLGIRALIDGTEIKVVAEATTGKSAAKLALEQDVDLVLLDVRMPDGDGLNALGHIQLDKPDLPVVLFSAFDNPTSVARAVAMGASGFLLKNCRREELLNTIRLVVSGKDVWAQETLREASRALRTTRLADCDEVSLSEREGDVLRHLTRGLTNRQIAEETGIRYEIVKVHVKDVVQKIGVVDRLQAALWAVRNNLA